VQSVTKSVGTYEVFEWSKGHINGQLSGRMREYSEEWGDQGPRRFASYRSAEAGVTV